MRVILKIDIESTIEYKALIALIHNYESEVKDKDMLEDVAVIMPDIISATDRFRIKKSFDLIGPIQCLKCEKKWIAILSKKIKEVPCPKCGFKNATLNKM